MDAGDVFITVGGESRLADCSGEWTVWYFGSDPLAPRRLAAGLAPGHRLAAAGERINAVARRIRGDMIQLDDRLVTGRFAWSWHASDLAERNPLISDFFLNVCRALSLTEAARSGGRHVVMLDDGTLAKPLARICEGAGLRVRQEGSGRTFNALLRGLDAHASFLRGWLRERMAARRVPAQAGALASADVLLVTWADQRVVEGEDRYWGRLPSVLKEAGISVGWLGNPAAWLAPIEGIFRAASRSARQPMFVMSRVFSLASLLRAYAGWLMFPFAVRRSFRLEGVELAPLVRRAVCREMLSPRLTRALLFASVGRALRSAGVKPRAVMTTYENQPWEKMLAAGIRRHLPGTRVIAAQHAPFSELYPSAVPSRRQWRDDAAPSCIAAVGDAFRDDLLAHGASTDRVTLAGTWRYEGIDTRVEREARGRERVVLATCSVDLGQSISLVAKAAEAVAPLSGLRLVVNFHPMTSAGFRDAVKSAVGGATDRVEFADGSAREWLRRADLLLYDSSATVFEAMAASVPAVYVASDTDLDLDKAAGVSALRCRDVSGLRAAVTRLLDDAGARAAQVEAARADLTRMFSPPDAAAWTHLARS